MPRGQGRSGHHGGLRQVSELAKSQPPGLEGRSALSQLGRPHGKPGDKDMYNWQEEEKGRQGTRCEVGQERLAEMSAQRTTGKTGENRHALVQSHTSCVAPATSTKHTECI